jgi:GT2 family glycosyltransferase
MPMSWTATTTRSRVASVALDPSPHPELSVVIVTFGTGPIVLDCLAAVGASLASIPYEVIVVDNHCRGGMPTASRLRLSTAGVRLVTASQNLGFGGGNEVGVAHASGENIALMNPDIVVSPGWAPPLLDAVSDPTVGIAAPVLLNDDGTVQEAGQVVDDRAVTRPVRLAPEGVVDVAYSSAACWLMRRGVHERSGGFDAAYHPAYFEDVDLAFRIRRLGLRSVVVADSRVTHRHGSSTRRRARPAFDQQAVFRRRWAQALRHPARFVSRS